MYGLDVNFLKDREIRPVEAPAARPVAPVGDRRPLYYGLAVALVALGLVGGYWLLLQQQLRTLRAQEAELDLEIADIRQQLDQLDQIREQTVLIEAETQAFVNIFEQIRPWSALLKELRDRTPVRIQITSVQQTAGTTPPGDTAATEDEATAAVPPPAGGVEIEGVACSFDDVNDFLLTLQRSPLLDGETVTVGQANLQAEIVDPQVFGSCPGSPADTPEVFVDFTLEGNLTDIPASALLDILDRQGSVGLATRIRALRDSGVIETP